MVWKEPFETYLFSQHLVGECDKFGFESRPRSVGNIATSFEVM
jgi:hypothetical protein